MGSEQHFRKLGIGNHLKMSPVWQSRLKSQNSTLNKRVNEYSQEIPRHYVGVLFALRGMQDDFWKILCLSLHEMKWIVS